MPRVSYSNMYASCCRRTFTFQMTGGQWYAAAMTGTIQGPIYLHLAQEWLSWCDSGLWGWVACTLDSLGCLQSDAWQELAPAATNLYERNSELLPSRYFEACHHRKKGLMIRFDSLLFTCPGRSEADTKWTIMKIKLLFHFYLYFCLSDENLFVLPFRWYDDIQQSRGHVFE